MLHAVALHQHGFGSQGWQGVVSDVVHQQVAQTFHAVAVQHHEAGARRGRVGRWALHGTLSLRHSQGQAMSLGQTFSGGSRLVCGALLRGGKRIQWSALNRQALVRQALRHARAHARDAADQVGPILEGLFSAGSQQSTGEWRANAA